LGWITGSGPNIILRHEKAGAGARTSGPVPEGIRRSVRRRTHDHCEGRERPAVTKPAYQKQITRQEKLKTRSDGAYWRRVEDFTHEIKENIDTERRYTRLLKDCTIAGAAAYGKSMDRVKEDIEERFTSRYLYTPTEYHQFRFESGDRDGPQQNSENGSSPIDKQAHKSRSGKNREPDDDRDR
jgi:hypothetical protein